MSEWQPIDTAPRGIPILIHADGITVVASLNDFFRARDGKWLLFVEPEGFSGHEWEWHFSEMEITHWMPLPQPPVA